MCSCGKFGDESYYAGCRRGVYEAHSVDFCTTKNLNTWRTRLFVPVAEFFDRLAGSFSSKALDELVVDAGRRRSEIVMEQRRAARRAAIDQAIQEAN